MSDSLRIADHLFNDAETLVESIEHGCRVEVQQQAIYDQITTETLPVTGAVTAAIWVIDRGQKRTLSRSGLAVSPESDSATADVPFAASESPDETSAYAPPLAKWPSRMQLTAREQLDRQTVIGFTLHFEQAVDGSLSRPLCELAETILSLASGVYLRHRFAALSEAAGDQTRRDDVLDQLNDGLGLIDSLNCIATTIARETKVDRVAILRGKGNSAQLLVSSTQPRVDRRARQVRLLERLAGKVMRSTDRFRYVVGDPEASDSDFGDAHFSNTLAEYLSDSGSRELLIEVIFQQQTESTRGAPVAVIALERFRLQDSAGDTPETLFNQLRRPASAAIRRAFERQQLGWAAITSQLASGGRAKRWILLACASALIALALGLVPGDFKIPVDGRLITAKHHRLFAPSAGTVIGLNVTNGQRVTAGQPLLQLRSAQLDQQQRQLEGALATAKSKLAVVSASRSRSAAERGSTRNSLASSDEQVLKTEVQGLQTQLDLVLKQQAELALHSPIDGRVDRWDLQQSLTGRPVMHGQYLVDVVSDVDGWIVQLDIPDAEARYVAVQQATEACDVSFRLRSNPEKLYRGKIKELSEVTQMDATGLPVVRATLQLDAVDPELRFGATVIAQVHCGTRPLGFIWFRSVIEWARELDWI